MVAKVEREGAGKRAKRERLLRYSTMRLGLEEGQKGGWWSEGLGRGGGEGGTYDGKRVKGGEGRNPPLRPHWTWVFCEGAVRGRTRSEGRRETGATARNGRTVDVGWGRTGGSSGREGEEELAGRGCSRERET